MKKKLNVNNLLLIIVFVISILVIVSDFLIITISTFMGKTAGWTWFGFITFMASWIYLEWSYSELKEIINNKKENR